VRCERCGAVQSASVTCPHCGANADASPHRELRYACDVCGGPRVTFADARVRPSEATVTALRAAQASRRGRARARALALASGLVLPFVVAIAVLLGLVAHAPLAAALLGGLGALGLVTLDVAALRRAKRHGAAMTTAIDEAWVAAAADVARAAGGAISAPELSRALRIRPAQAEELLAILEATDVVRSLVSDDGEIAFRARISVDQASDPHGVTILAEHEADAEHEAASALAARSTKP
jgi:hypothetical protein